MIHSADTPAWLRSGIENLNRDPRIKFAGDTAPAAEVVALDVELLKAYMLSLPTAKSANLVIRVRFSGRGGATSEQTYRGLDSGMNWNSGAGEMQSAFDSAMVQVLKALDGDIIARCGAV
jgi:hypothetical protein